ncbi:MAG: PIG-L family deacetylase [Chitinophagales bacterium]
MKKLFVAVWLLFVVQCLNAQQVEWNSSRILLEIEKLNTIGSVLYIAAHPDDENTRLITYLANEKKVRTGYLSLTRGDGGQNLIGEEQGAYLGVIRTQELLAARKVDGGEQFFTRAVDFGYSKSADETFTKWPHDSLLSDVVWVIRNFRPDIIIMRFPADERAGHGQHTVSALIAEEAFDAAADPNKFPEQLKYVSVWKTKRIFWNNSLRWDETLPEKIKNGDKNIVSFDVGGYNTLLGKSYGEIAAESRTNHKSQGFGATPTRGEQIEYLYLKKGDPLSSFNDVLGDVNITWERYRQGGEIKILLDNIIADYDISHPEKSVDALLKVYDLIHQLPDDKLVEYKTQQLQNIIVACLGLWMEPVVEKSEVVNGETIKVVSSCIKRNDYPISLALIMTPGELIKVGEILPVGINQVDTIEMRVWNVVSSSPFWLKKSYDGLFWVDDVELIGKPENDPSFKFTYYIKMGERTLAFDREIVFKETDAVKGEVYKPVVVLPEISLHIDQKNIFYSDMNEKDIAVNITANKDYSDVLSIIANNGATISPKTIQLDLKKGETKQYTFTVKAHDEITNIQFELNRKDTLLGINENLEEYMTIIPITVGEAYIINYDHIPVQIILESASIKLTKMDISLPDKKIAYIEGAGDKVDESLAQLGLNISTLKPEEITADELKNYDVVIIGVRAYNVSKAMADNQQTLMNYVRDGGLLITQYSTNWDMYTENIGPFPFKIKRGRVTDENSPVDFLLPEHPVLNVPNKIINDDFKGWVQERGIYFAEELASEYKTPLAFTDPNEQPQNGSLIIADYGKGAFIYTGIAFFRELPAGVPGAFRLFMNLISYENPNN